MPSFWEVFWGPSTTELVYKVLKNQGEIMATMQEILDKLAEANVSLDGIQADITALKALVDGGADLTAISDAVTALAAKAAGIDIQTP